MDQTANLSVTHDGGASIVEIVGEHDIASAPRLRQLVQEAVAEGSPTVIELSLATFIDSSVLGALLGGLRDARTAGHGYTFVVTADSGAVHRVVELTGLLAIFPVYGSRAAAIAAAREGVNAPP